MKTIILLLTFFSTFSCGRTNAVDPAAQEVTQAGQEQNLTAAPYTQLLVGPIEFFASWRESYIKLEQWKDSNDPKVPHPETFDILCSIENKGNSVIQHGDFIIVTTIDSVVAPTYLHGGDVNKIVNEVGWAPVAAMEDVKLERVPYLEAKGSTKVKIEGFQLGSLLKQFSGEDDTLWPWALRVNVRVLTRDMTQVAVGQAILPMIPSDRRLSAK